MRRPISFGGTEGNRNLTALLGAVLLVGILVELGTLVVGLGQTMAVHIAVGVALIPVVAVKLGSTGWRMIHYYIHDPAYRAEGPPQPFLRGIAPIAVGATVALLGSGVGLVFARQDRGVLNEIHSKAFAVFLVVVGVHSLLYLPKLRRFAFADRAQGSALRRGLVGFALVAGGTFAVVAVEHAHPWLMHGFDR